MAATSPLFFCLPSSYASSKLLCSMGKGTSVQLPEVLSLHKGSRPLLSFSNGSHAAVLMLRISLPFSEMQDASDGWKSIPHTQPNDLPAFSRNQIAGAVRWPPWIVCFFAVFRVSSALWDLRGNRDAVWCWRLAGVAVVFIYLPHLPGEGPSQFVANPKLSCTYVRSGRVRAPVVVLIA